jgi:hypothetical protein
VDKQREVELGSIATFTEALHHCWLGSGVCAKDMAGRLGIDYNQFVRMFSGSDSRNFPPDLIPALMRESKSVLPLEWLAWQMGFQLYTKDMLNVLDAIRTALEKDGRSARFSRKSIEGGDAI